MLTLSIPTGNNGNNSQPSTGSSNSSPALQMLRQPQNESKMLFDNVVNPRNNSQIPSTGKSVSLGHLPSGHNGMAHNYGSLINNNIPNNSLNPLGMNNNGSNIMGGMMPQGQGQQIPQPAYYVQQPVYLDQNGQPMYYRSGNSYIYTTKWAIFILIDTSLLGPEFLYPGMDASNNQLGNLMGNGDPNISGMQNNFGGYNNMQGHMPNSVMWQGNMQNGDPSVYMNAQHGMQAPRIMFNPVTGLYTTIPASSSMPGLMPGNQQNTMIQGRGGNNMNSPSMYGQNVPGNNMMQGLMTNNNSMGIPALLPRAQMGILGPDGTDNQSAYFNRDDHHSADYQRKDHRNNRDDMDYSGRGNDRRDRDQYGKNDRDRGDRRERGDRGDRDRRNGTATNGVNPVRDSLVEDFRNTYGKSRQWSLRDLTGHVVAFCQDQHGSRFIQQRLEECADSDKQIVFDEIIPAAQQLMTDVFGNYVLQKLFEYGNADQCESLAELLKGQAVILAMQMYGCRVVQKALEYVNTDRLIELVSEFDDPSVSYCKTSELQKS